MALLDDLMGQLEGVPARQIAGQLGLGPQQANAAIAAALPMLLGGLTRNSATREGATSLLSALDRDHDGSVLDDLAGFLQQGSGGAGAGILGHVFGGRQSNVENAVSRVSGIDPGKAASLLAMLAPLVMGALGRAQRGGGLDAGGLADLLGRQRSAPPATGAGSSALGGLAGMLDADRDGDLMDDLTNLGGGLLGRFLGGR